MALKDVAPLKKFLKPFSPEAVERALWLRELIWKTFPDANELIYDNYNAVAFGWSPTEKVGQTFVSIAVGRSTNNVHCGFYWGSKISDPKKILIGEGNQYRYLILEDTKTFPVKYVKELMNSALDYSLSLVKNEKDLKQGLTIVKSISPVKRAKTAAKKSSTKRKR